MRELLILLLGSLLIFTVLKDMVHMIFTIPYFIVSFGMLLWAVMPSRANPELKNYMSIILFFRRDKQTYHPIDVHKYENLRLSEYHEDFAYMRSIEQTIAKIESPSDLLKETVYDLPVQEEVKEQIEELVENIEVEGEKTENVVPRLENTVESLDQIKEEIKMQTEENDWNKINDMVSNIDNIGTKKANDTEMEANIPNITMKNKKQIKGLKMKRFMTKKTVFFIMASLFAFAIGIGVFSSSILNFNTESAENKEQEEALVEALRSSSLQYYDEAIVYFDKIDYFSLENDDKDAMLLAYLFADKSEVAIGLEPSFSETVVSYYKATHDMQKIKDLDKEVDSNVIKFEVAVNDKDYETIIKLKDEVKMKEDRQQQVVEAYLSLDDVDGAKDFVATVDNENLLMDLKRHEEKMESKKIEEEKKNKDKKKKNKKNKTKGND